MIMANGVPHEGMEGKTIADFLRKEGYDRMRVAVELNGQILSKSSYDAVTLKDEDTIEVVSFVGGG